MSENKDKPILCLDFDGVMHSYTSGWHGDEVIPGPPVPGLFEFLVEASERFDVAVFSTRSRTAAGRVSMRRWFYSHYIAWLRSSERHGKNNSVKLSWPSEKPQAMVTLDDRAITFNGAFPRVQALLNFLPWNKRESLWQYPPGDWRAGHRPDDRETMAAHRVMRYLGVETDGHETLSRAANAIAKELALLREEERERLTTESWRRGKMPSKVFYSNPFDYRHRGWLREGDGAPIDLREAAIQSVVAQLYERVDKGEIRLPVNLRLLERNLGEGRLQIVLEADAGEGV